MATFSGKKIFISGLSGCTIFFHIFSKNDSIFEGKNLYWILHFWPVWLYHIFPHFLKNGNIFGKKFFIGYYISGLSGCTIFFHIFSKNDIFGEKIFIGYYISGLSGCTIFFHICSKMAKFSVRKTLLNITFLLIFRKTFA